MNQLTQAAHNIANRLRNLAERPASLTVRDVIDRYMGVYAGRDKAIGQRLQAWQAMIGEYTLENVDSDLIHAGRHELLTAPALTYKGRDHVGAQIFKPKLRKAVKSTATINRYLSSLGSVFTWAIEQRLTPRGWVHPCRGIKRMAESEGRVRFLDNDERERLFAACHKSKYPRFYALVLTAMLTGARRGELLALTWQDVDLEAGIASLGRSKNGDRRTLVLLPQVVAALAPFKSSDGHRYVFGAMKTRQQTPASVDTAWLEAVKRAQIKDFRFHDLRHCCASYMAQNSVPLNVIAEVLGHRKLDMSRRYAHLTVQTKSEAMHSALGKIGV